MPGLQQFANRIDDIGKDIENRANRYSKDIAFGVVDQVIADSPVDTTRFVSNWRVGIGNPPQRFTGPHFPGRQGETAPASRLRAKELAATKISSASPGQDLWVSNTAPYGPRLAEGYSPQAAAGWVQRALRRGVRNAVNQFRGPLATRF